MPSTWPSLPLEAWRDSHATLHMWLQIVGKIRMAQSPWVNHSWSVTLYVTARGLTTSPIPHRTGAFEITFDFVDHQLAVRCQDGRAANLALEPQSVATFYARFMEALHRLDLDVTISPQPCEVPDAIRFDRDEVHRSYDPDWVQRYWRILVESDRVLTQFRARFLGKCSPVHVFWGGPDMAVTRFSGRRAPPFPGAVIGMPAWVAHEAYSHEVSSCGFWAGGGAVPDAAYYSYAYPEPAGFADARVEPAGAYYQKDLQQFILPYEVVRNAPRPDDALLAFAQSTYAAAADLGAWDRAALERDRDPRSAAAQASSRLQ